MGKLKRHYFLATFTYDEEADAAYIYLAPKSRKSVKTHEITKEMFVDIDKDGAVIGIELLGGNLLPAAMRKIAGLE